MKIEKISENKIRIILKQSDFKDKSVNLEKLLLETSESQKLFLEILNRARKEVDFDTDGHKLLIESYFLNDDSYIFTITKYIDSTNIINTKPKKYLMVKRKSHSLNYSSCIYQFDNFDNFGAFCNFLSNSHFKNIKEIFKTAILYYYNNTYYLAIENFNAYNEFSDCFHSSLLEFCNSYISNENFKCKLKEHGKIIMKNNALNTGMKYFTYK